MFSEGTLGQKKNSGLRFVEDSNLKDPNAPYLETNPAMAHHTLKSVKINFPRDYYWDTQAEDIFFRLAECFIKIKRHHSIKQSFHDFAEEVGLILQPEKVEIPKKLARFFWWRRQQRRFRRREARN
jgi:hypothetical protein